MKRAVRTLIRLVAAGFIVFGGMEFGLELTRRRLQNAGISVWHCLLGGILVIVGGVLMAASSRLAERLADDFEE